MPTRLTVLLVTLLVAAPAVVFWLWLAILPARVAKLCPMECWCDAGGYFVNCTDSSLNSIPLTFPAAVRGFLLRDNSITSFEKDSFIRRGLTELEILLADNCEIRTIEVGAFNGLTKLTLLSMQYIDISNITKGTFENMSRLEKLKLGYNGIEHLEVGVFSGLINLKFTDLQRNRLQYLHPDIFVGLPNLRYLILSENPNLQIPTYRHFINSHSLSRLDISNCNVGSVSVETFAKVTALIWLVLSDNSLRSVDINVLKVLPKLSELHLHGNPLQCDCQLQEVWRWCQDHNIETTLRGTASECDTPSEVQGMWWGVLEKAQCSQDNISYRGDYKNTRNSYTPIQDTNLYDFTYFTSFSKYYEAPVYTVLFIFGATGNVIILIIIVGNKDMHTVPNMYILNLAISDMICIMVHISAICTDRISDNWTKSTFVCKFFPFCHRLSVGLSVYSVAMLSILRYRATVNPLNACVSSQPTWRGTMATICGVWIVAALFAIPSAFSEYLCLRCWVYGCEIYYQHVVLFELLVSCVLPVCVIALSYIITACHLLNSAQPISADTKHPQLNTRKNTARILLGLTVVFQISYAPYHVLLTYFFSSNLWLATHDWYRTVVYTHLLSTSLLLLNPCLSPLALCCTSLDFRRQFKRYLACRWKANSSVTNIELAGRN